jgi:hypothetical protein
MATVNIFTEGEKKILETILRNHIRELIASPFCFEKDKFTVYWLFVTSPSENAIMYFVKVTTDQ